MPSDKMPCMSILVLHPEESHIKIGNLIANCVTKKGKESCPIFFKQICDERALITALDSNTKFGLVVHIAAPDEAGLAIALLKHLREGRGRYLPHKNLPYILVARTASAAKTSEEAKRAGALKHYETFEIEEIVGILCIVYKKSQLCPKSLP